MAAQNGLNFATSLFFAGMFNIITGLTFSIPMAVQPMKAIAAVALTEGLTAQQSDAEFNTALKDSVDKIYQASIS